jgi:hypothetical protein
MKFQVVLSFLIIAAVSFVLADPERMRTMLRGIALECKVNEDASDDDLSRLVGKKMIESREGKCMIACILEQMGVMEDGKFIATGFIEFGSEFTGGAPNGNKLLEELASECGMLKNDDRCDLALMVMGCMKMGGMKRKLEFGI